jgi:hypothetical protein
MQTIYAVDEKFNPFSYEVFSEGDVVELVDNRNMVNPTDKRIYVVEKFCPQYGVADKIKTTCGCYINAYRFKLVRTHKFRVKNS